ncbi:MAG TPA: hypothetical protein PKD85_14255, partial [Saprospiraceae bacterium]|nr:hypothetical protein [Saprospiraceae bacterium]
VGASPATNVVLKAEILDPLDNVIYSQNNAYGTIGCFETIENIPFDQLHTQKFDEPGVYSIKYTISADTNIVSTNDAIEIPFIISDSTFANITRETPTNQFLRGARSFWNPTFWDANVGTTQTSLGNFYKVTAGKNKAVSKVRFGLDNTNTAMQGFVIVDLYRVFDENGDYILDPNDRVLLGTETLVVTNQTPNLRFIEVDIKDADGKPILLEDNSDYAVVIHTEGISGSAST